MSEGNDYASKMLRLHTEAAQARLRAIESQLALGATLCSLAETEILYDQIAEARKIIEKVQHSVESIRFHLDEPNYIPTNSTAGLRDQLAQLETRLRGVQSRISKDDE